VTLVHADVYEEAQYQNPASIGPQRPVPGGDHDIELSWDRAAGYMRIIIHDGHTPFTWHFKELLGACVATGADSERGRLNFYGGARVDGETLTLYRPDDAEPHPIVEGLVRPPSLYRGCYRRMDKVWRSRDEKLDWNDPSALMIVTDMVGDFSVEWRLQDRVAHIFHNGWQIIDRHDVCHCYDLSITPYVSM
jgi:hypothetical protein